MELSLKQPQPLVVDSSVIAAHFIEEDAHHTDARAYIDGLERGDYVFHLPMLVVVEVSATIRRRLRRWRRSYAQWHAKLAQWEREGKVTLYPLSRERMEGAAAAALGRRLSGADSVISALAEELNMPLRTFDRELRERGPGAVL